MSNALRLKRDPLRFLIRLARDFGDVVRFRVGHRQVFLVNKPDYIKEVLVTQHQNFVKSRGLHLAKHFLGEGLLTSDGEFHIRQRRLVQPAFHRQRLNAYGSVMTQYAAEARERWREGETRDIFNEMMHVTIRVAGRTLFDTDAEEAAREVQAATAVFMRLFNSPTLRCAEVFQRLPLPGSIELRTTRAQLDAFIYRVIDERRASGEDRGDLLSMLLHSQDAEGATGGMSNLQVRDEAITLLLAGHETVSNVLAWTWYLLSQNLAAEAKLHDEVDKVLDGRLPVVDDLPRLKYTQMVIDEVMRLYPPAWTLARRAVGDCEIGGYRIPARSVLLMSQYVMHRDPRYYPDPERFDPDRWTPESRATRPAFSYFPFGGGPRLCIGDQFAKMECALVIATIAQRWRLRLAGGHRIAVAPQLTLRPKHGVWMQIERRQNPGQPEVDRREAELDGHALDQ